MSACKIAELHAFRLGWFSAQHGVPDGVAHFAGVLLDALPTGQPVLRIPGELQLQAPLLRQLQQIPLAVICLMGSLGSPSGSEPAGSGGLRACGGTRR
jgi:hypothetical protein